jgi:glycosyltransferase involved in cell wall biosynthesis
MKIAVYTVALNEEKHVERWYESIKDADYILIADTGSTDKTVKIAKKLGIKVFNISVKPWRFDDSRNAALALLPDDIDYCVSMDMDETMSEGWRECLEKMTADQIDYMFHINFRDEAEEVPATKMINNRIHKRHGFRWHYFMHEAVIPDIRIRDIMTREFCEGLIVSHHPDPEKSREQYNDMIEYAYKEYKDARYYIYHILQLKSFGRNEECITVINEFIKSGLCVNQFELSSLYRYLASCYVSTKPKKVLSLLKKANKIFPQSKEALMDLALYYFEKEKWHKCYKYAKQAVVLKKKPMSMFIGEYAWGYLPENLYSVSKFNRKLWKWSKSYDEKKRIIKPGTPIPHNFKLFED